MLPMLTSIDDTEACMTDDSMSVSSGELPDTSKAPSEAAVVSPEQRPTEVSQVQLQREPPATTVAHTSPMKGHVGFGNIPKAPIRFFDPREKRVLGLTDERNNSRDRQGFNSTAHQEVVQAVKPHIPNATNAANQLQTQETPPFVPYESPLKSFKDFRYHQQFQEVTSKGFQSPTWSHDIDADLPFCPQELQAGTCNDSNCGYQHFRDLDLKRMVTFPLDMAGGWSLPQLSTP